MKRNQNADTTSSSTFVGDLCLKLSRKKKTTDDQKCNWELLRISTSERRHVVLMQNNNLLNTVPKSVIWSLSVVVLIVSSSEVNIYLDLG